VFVLTEQSCCATISGRPVVIQPLDPQFPPSRKRKKRTSIDQKKRIILDTKFEQVKISSEKVFEILLCE